MATKTRLTKKTVLDEIEGLREKIRTYGAMTHDQLRVEYSSWFLSDPQEEVAKMSRELLIQRLLMRDTYHLTNVLSLE